MEIVQLPQFPTSDYGLLLCASGEIDPGYQFGELALDILEHFPG